MRPVLTWLAPAITGVFTALTALEILNPLRRAVEPKARRLARNLAVAGLSLAAVRLAEIPLVLPLAARVERNGWGLLRAHPLWEKGTPAWLEIILACALLDYTLYLWHVLTHKIPFLWRFHRVHHADLDLDASTALRFHFGEMILSVPWRAAQVVLIGVSPQALLVWQNALLISILFHHSNIRLPIGIERRLCRWIITPRLHGIHHSMVAAERDSNWSSGLTAWDQLHGTLRLDPPQEEITIGVPELKESSQVTLGRMLALPFLRLEHPRL